MGGVKSGVLLAFFLKYIGKKKGMIVLVRIYNMITQCPSIKK
jgi:hypothetical protein